MYALEYRIYLVVAMELKVLLAPIPDFVTPYIKHAVASRRSAKDTSTTTSAASISCAFPLFKTHTRSRVVVLLYVLVKPRLLLPISPQRAPGDM